MSVLSKIFSNLANTSIFFGKKSKEPESALNKFNIMNALGVIVYTSLEDKEVKYLNKAFSLEYEGNEESLDSNSFDSLKFESQMIVTASSASDIQLTLENIIKEHLNNNDDLSNNLDENKNDNTNNNFGDIVKSQDDRDNAQESAEQESPKVHQLDQASAHQAFERDLSNNYDVVLSPVGPLTIADLIAFKYKFPDFEYPLKEIIEFGSTSQPPNPLIVSSFSVDVYEDSIDNLINLLANVTGGVGPYTVTSYGNGNSRLSTLGVSLSLDGSQNIDYDTFPLLPNYPTPTIDTDSFTYTVMDSLGQTSSGTVTVNLLPVVDTPHLVVEYDLPYHYYTIKNVGSQRFGFIDSVNLNDLDGSEQLFLNVSIRGFTPDPIYDLFEFSFTDGSNTSPFQNTQFDGDDWDLNNLKLLITDTKNSTNIQDYYKAWTFLDNNNDPFYLDITATAIERDLGFPGITTPIQTVEGNFGPIPVIASSFSVDVYEDSIDNLINLLSNVTGGLGPYTVTSYGNSNKSTLGVSLFLDGSQNIDYDAFPVLLNYPTPTIDTDSFTYTVMDSLGQTSSGTVTVNLLPVVDTPILDAVDELRYQFNSIYKGSQLQDFINDVYLKDLDGSEQLFLNVSIRNFTPVPGIELFNFLFYDGFNTSLFQDTQFDGDVWNLNNLSLIITDTSNSNDISDYNNAYDFLYNNDNPFYLDITATAIERDLGVPGITTPIQTVDVIFEPIA